MTARRVLLTTWFASAAAFVPSTRLAGVGQRRCATALPRGSCGVPPRGNGSSSARRARPLGAQASDADEDFFAPDVRTPARTFGIFGLWAALIAYVALGAPGKDAASQALDNELLFKLIANPFDPSCPPLFTVLFNYMGIWPAAYAAVLLPGADAQEPAPAAPFVLGSIAFGMFALSPYLALRRYAPGPGIARGDGAVDKFLESRIVAGFLLGGALGLAAFGATANGGDVGASARLEFKALFDSQLFVHVTTLDFCSLWLLFYGPLVEDMRRRGMDTSAAPLFAAVPIFGAATCTHTGTRLPEQRARRLA